MNILKNEENLDWTFLSPAIEMTQEKFRNSYTIIQNRLEKSSVDEMEETFFSRGYGNCDC
jgi:putative NADH-flavin reductase